MDFNDIRNTKKKTTMYTYFSLITFNDMYPKSGTVPGGIV